MQKFKNSSLAAIMAAIIIPVFYLFYYTPLGMDTTDFGYFYGYAWRILQGQIPYRDFFYIKPAFPLYWHAFWMWLTPVKYQILCGKIGFLVEMLAMSWLVSLYTLKLFNLKKMQLHVALLATCGFVFSIHTFPHMPWHTADGALFCALSLWAAAFSHPLIAGCAAGCAVLCKQSFALVPFGILFLLWFLRRNNCIWFILSFIAVLAIFFGWIYVNGAWDNFKEMTTGQLNIEEAFEAGFLIYLRQNWLLPLGAVMPWLFIKYVAKKQCPAWLLPAWCYLIILTIWYIIKVMIEKTWIGFGVSWPTLFMVLGEICIFWPAYFLAAFVRPIDKRHPLLLASAAFSASHLIAWSCSISGGYKIPAFFSVPLIFGFFIFHAKFAGTAKNLAWGTIISGLIMFWTGWQYPYVFPERPLNKSDLIYDAGEVYTKASGVFVDKDMLEKLEELKQLRNKYGSKYKTLPGFTLAYYLNNDYPIVPSDWLIDWEINAKADQLYDELVADNITIFMEKDQLDAKKADAYARSGYSVPQLISNKWRRVEETPHFVVFQRPS